MIRLKKNDIIVMAAILLLSGVFYALGILSPKDAGAQVLIRIDGELYKSLPLDKDGSYPIKQETGDYNLVVIKDGKAFIQEASCPDKLCIRQGKISFENETVVCLPNKLVLEIDGSTDAPGLDAVAK